MNKDAWNNLKNRRMPKSMRLSEYHSYIIEQLNKSVCLIKDFIKIDEEKELKELMKNESELLNDILHKNSKNHCNIKL